MDALARISKIYPSLPVAERRNTAVIVYGQPYSWEMCYREIQSRTELGNQIGAQMIASGLI
jgi:hypothetical protein